MTPKTFHDLPAWDAAVLDARRLVARVQKCQLYQFADPFDNYNTASQIYDVVSGTIAYSSAYARFAPPAGLPGQGIKVNGSSYIGKNLQSNQAILIPKFAVNFSNLSGGVGAFTQLSDNNTAQCSLCMNPNGALSLYRGHGSAGTLLLSTGPGVIAAGLYYSIEWTATINATTGAAQVWVNGVLVINATGLNTQVTANAYANQAFLGDLNGFLGSIMYDDFRVWDSTGSTQNAALGTDSRLVTKMPSGAGAATNFTPNGAAANWQCVDDNPPDDDTTYVSGAGTAIIDSCAMPNAGFTAAPAMVLARSRVRKDDGATRSLEVGVSSSGTTGYGASTAVGATYARVDACIALDPNTGLAWTAAGADAAQHSKQETA